ncbi:hypothetical protein SAMN05444672_101438 [Bacillus sp. OK838]|nr:hypothetical protein SAMN05444672_101438 [Bacillus sp. OK838]
MTKRKGLLDVKVDVRGLLEELPVSNSAASKLGLNSLLF